MRQANWPELLAQYINDQRAKPFVWGEHDCATFAAGWINVCTGKAIALPNYSSAVDAAVITRKKALREWAIETLGEPYEKPLTAKRGDIVLADYEGREGFGVVIANGIAAPGADHLLIVPIQKTAVAWPVD